MSQYFVVHKNMKYGFMDSRGVIKINPIFDSAEPFVKGNAAVSLNSKWGLIDSSGTFVIRPQYQKISSLGDSLVGISLDGKFGVENIYTQEKINPQFDKVEPFVKRSFIGYKGNKAGLFNISGDVLIPLDFYKFYSSENQTYITAESDSEKVVYNSCMDSIMAFSIKSELYYFPSFVVNKQANRCRLIYDKNGLFVDSVPKAKAYSISPNIMGLTHYQDSQTVCTYFNGKASIFPMNNYEWVNIEFLIIQNGKGKKALFNRLGEQLSDFAYSAIGFNQSTSMFIYQSELGSQLGTEREMFNGAEVYDRISYLSSRLLSVMKDGKCGVVNTLGKKVLGCEYDGFDGDSVDLKAYSEKGVVLVSFDKLGAVKEFRRFKNFSRIRINQRTIPDNNFSNVWWDSRNKKCLDEKKFGWFTKNRGRSKFFGLVDMISGDTLIKPRYNSVCVCDSTGLTKVGFNKKKKDGVRFLNENKGKYTVYGLVDRRGRRLTYLRYQSIDEQTLRDASFNYLRTVSEQFPSSVTLIKIGDKKYRKTYRFVDRSYNGLARATKKGYFKTASNNINILGWSDYFLRTFSTSLNNSFRSREGVKGVSIEQAEWGFINSLGDETISFEFDYVTNFKNGISFVRKDSKWGAIDTNGTVIIPLKYSYIDYASWNDSVIQVFNDSRNWGILSNKGELLIKPQYKIIQGSYHGQYLVGDSKRKFKYINKEGGLSFPAIKSANYGVFKDGVAMVGIRRKWGMIDSTGETLIEPLYRVIGDYNSTYFTAKLKASWQIYNYNSEELLSFNPRRITYLGKDFFIGSKKYKLGVFDLEGKKIIRPRFFYIAYHDKGFLVSKNRKLGWYNKKGEKIIPAKFNKLYISSENRIVGVRKRKVYGFNFLGERIFKIDTLFDCKEFSDGLVPVFGMKGWGAIDSMGNTAVRAGYYRFESFHDSTSAIFRNNKAALMFKDGKILHNKWYNWIGAYSDGCYSVGLNGGGMNFLTTKGALVNGVHYTHVRNFLDGYAVVFTDKAGVINKSGVTVIPHRYQDLKVITGNGFKYKASETYGFYRLDGRPLNKKPISKIVFQDNLIQCLQGVEIGYLDRQGNVVRNIQ